MANSFKQQSTVERKIKQLQMRVMLLERALKPAKLVRTKDEIDRDRNRAEETARNNALREYYEQKKVERYLRDPNWLAVDLACEKEAADFLRSRGLKPEPSKIPKQFRRG